MKKSRKKILLSSIAMLLVALVALGSATFAWFTIQRTVKADSMQVSATAQKGIEITIDNGTTGGSNTKHFTSTADDVNPISWASNKTLAGFVPAQEVTDANATSYSGTYKSTGTVPAAETAAATEAFKQGNNFTVYRVGVRSAAQTGGTVTPYAIAAAVKISAIAGKDATGYARVALYNETTSTVVATYAANDTSDSAVNGTAADAKTTVNLTSSDASVNVSDSGADWTYYQLIVWFEGTDSDCVDTNADKGVNVEISFTASDK